MQRTEIFPKAYPDALKPTSHSPALLPKRDLKDHNINLGDHITPIFKSGKEIHMLLYFNQDVNPNLGTCSVLMPFSSSAILIIKILKLDLTLTFGELHFLGTD